MKGMALIGAILHFGYSDMMGMDLEEFMEFVKIANDIAEKQAQ